MSAAARLLRHPTLSLVILALWLALAGSFAPGHLLLGAALGLSIPWLTHAFWPDPPRVARPDAAVRLFFVVLYDIVVANWIVARRVLGPLERLRPSFVEMPLDAEDFFVATILGSIISLTPGTVSIDIDRQRRILTVHALDVEDTEALIRTIKARYEAPLKEIFAC